MKIVTLFLAFLLCFTALQARPLRIGVAGVTHDHLGGVVSALKGGDVEVVGVWEADERYLHDNALTGKVPDKVFAVLRQNKPSVYPKVDDDAEIMLSYGNVTVNTSARRGAAVTL